MATMSNMPATASDSITLAACDHPIDPNDVASLTEERMRSEALHKLRGRQQWTLPYCKWCHDMPRMAGSNYCSVECCADASKAERKEGARYGR